MFKFTQNVMKPIMDQDAFCSSVWMHKNLKSSEFTKETHHNRRDFSGHY